MKWLWLRLSIRGALPEPVWMYASVEPPKAENPLLRARNCVITPHLAWGTRAARQRLMDAAVGNVRAFLAGNPQNVVN